jgi:hypothetical protein
MTEEMPIIVGCAEQSEAHHSRTMRLVPRHILCTEYKQLGDVGIEVAYDGMEMEIEL